jgi:phage terminase large subunit
MPEIRVRYTRVFAETRASRKRIVINVGGARSSKSYSVAQLLLSKFLTETNKTFIIARKTFPALRATAMHDVLAILQDWEVYGVLDHNKSDSTITNTERGNIIRFISIEDPTRIRSMQANYVWMEEANEFTFADFLTLKTRLSSPTTDGNPNQMFLTLNPSDSYGWINQRLVNAAADARAESQSNVEVIVSSYKDNPFLDKDYIQSLEDLKHEDETYYKIFALGVWAQSGSIIYSNYVIEPASSFPKMYDEEFVGLDFGFNNPAAGILVCVKDNEAFIRELVYKSHLTNSDLIQRVREELPPEHKRALLRADEAEPDRIEEFQRAGFRIEAAPKGKNSLRDGIDFCKRLRWHISDDSLNVIKEVRGYKWKEKDGLVLDEPVKFLDHSMDAIRYALTALKTFKHPAVSWGGSINAPSKPEWQ